MIRRVVDTARWPALVAIAEQQYGLLTRGQVLCVLSHRQLEQRARSGLLVPVRRGVWRLAGVERTWRQRAMAACLAIGPPVAVSHLSAARLWRFDSVDGRGRVHVAVPPHRSSRPPDLVVHRMALADDEVTVRFGLPVTSAARTLGDLARAVGPDVLAQAVDEAMRRRLLAVADLAELRDRCVGRSGAVDLARIVELRSGGVGDNAWEERVFQWIVGGGLPAPVRQYHVELPSGVAVLDMAYLVEKVGVEFDGWAWHRGRRRFDRDRRRMTELSLAGWRMVYVTAAQGPAEVIDQVRRALGS